jgi:hypothetical protein
MKLRTDWMESYLDNGNRYEGSKYVVVDNNCIAYYFQTPEEANTVFLEAFDDTNSEGR